MCVRVCVCACVYEGVCLCVREGVCLCVEVCSHLKCSYLASVVVLLTSNANWHTAHSPHGRLLSVKQSLAYYGKNHYDVITYYLSNTLFRHYNT